jgi:hypothetical protein
MISWVVLFRNHLHPNAPLHVHLLLLVHGFVNAPSAEPHPLIGSNLTES